MTTRPENSAITPQAQRGSAGARARVLIVEDEAPIRDALAVAYRQAGFDTRALPDGGRFEEQVDSYRPDLVVLDVMLPDRNGFELAAALRARTDCAVLFLTARDELDDRLQGFAVGADDYVAKPFAVAEVLARSGAALRRLGRLPATMQVGDLVLDEAAAVASRGDAVLDLTGTEWRLLAYLATNRGRTMSKTQILTQVWGYEDYDPNLVEVHVSALRRKIEVHGPRLIHTVRGLGYVLKA